MDKGFRERQWSLWKAGMGDRGGDVTGDRNPLELVAVAEDDVLDTEQSGVKAVQGRGW